MSSPDWPYKDLALRTPHCPWCGAAAQMLVGSNLHPMAFCTNDDCRALTWDPSVAARDLLANAAEVPLLVDTQDDNTPLEETPPLPFPG